MINIEGKNITVVGLGRSGLSAAKFLSEKKAVVSVTDSSDSKSIRKNVKELDGAIKRFEIGVHTRNFVVGQDMIVISPGVTLGNPLLQWARELNIPVISEIELAWSFSKGHIIAVTGSNGKSTTTTLIGQIFKNAKKEVFVCGNIGEPFCDYITKTGQESFVVLEISSAQLETISTFRPKISIILNITPNHLDRYCSIEEYSSFKARIFENQKSDDYTILNFDDIYTKKLANLTNTKVLFFTMKGPINGAYVDDGYVCVRLNNKAEKICSIDDIRIKGSHNIANTLASALAAKIFGIDNKYIIETLKNFNGLPNRIEYVDTIDGVEFINDSKSTTVDATLAALDTQTKPVILIAGGKDKGADFRPLRVVLKNKVKVLILIGQAKEKLETQLSGTTKMVKAATLEEAVTLALEEASEGYAVLLSPMCASFDMFLDYEDRGKKFKKAVKNLKLQKVKADAKHSY